MTTTRALIQHLPQLIPLFNEYRVFYKQSSNLEAAQTFLKERFLKNDSVIFIALNTNDEGIGFTQLYPSYSSVSMQRTYILNDLFVSPKFRKKGIGEKLMEAAKQFAIAEGSKGLTLETDIDNPAQKLYKRLGWIKDIHVNHYTWEV
jgi:GNAT superfamily N-acetyltransferase